MARSIPRWIIPALWATLAPVLWADQRPSPRESIGRAVAYLSREVPRWTVEHDCHSCHHNGDAARALLAADQRGYRVPRAALADTLPWLTHPARWDEEAGDSPFRDRELAAIQFGSAAAHAARTGRIEAPEALATAAEMLAAIQQPTGAWRVDRSGFGGSPIVYGDALATAAARQVLVQAGSDLFAGPIEKADQWLRAARPKALAEAAAVVLAVAGAADPAAQAQRVRFVRLAREAQHDSGAWGPFAGHRAEPFDTAMVLLALGQLPADSHQGQMVDRMIDAGLGWLIQNQNEDGSWTETTRPGGSESYAHRISTTAWVLQALLAAEG